MTAPVQEPTQGRTTSGLGYGQRQLYRRPMPTSEAAVIPGLEWVRFRSDTNLSTTYTQAQFIRNAGDWDPGLPPTFTIDSASPGVTPGNMIINKDGVYTAYLVVTSEGIAAGVDTVFICETVHNSGALPQAPYGSFGGETTHTIRRLDSTGTFDIIAGPVPVMTLPFILRTGDIADDGPFEWYVNAYYEEDGVGVAHATQQIYIFIIRHGDTWEN